MSFSFLFATGTLLCLALLAGLAKLAVVTGVAYILFPELAALAYDVFVRPLGVWARAPVMLILTPTLAAVAGTVVTRILPYGLVSAALCIAAAMLLIRVLRSPVAPAISAGFLPLTLGVTSWWYPASIAAVTGALALISLAQRRLWAARINAAPVPQADAIDDELERTPRRYTWLPVYAAFLLLAYGMVALTGLRFILFPPLAVAAFEMFAHPNVCPWARRPFTLPLACTITALAGVLALAALGAGAASVAVALAVGIAALRLLRLHLPPALAVGLLPQVMPHADWRFALAVGIGTTTLTVVFLLTRRLLLRRASGFEIPLNQGNAE